ncbi:MAG: hypothetical protein RQ754_02515 [Desulfuromonadales bacterium]|nr:hypothetical protein [Desulfuromonadales bacterium]
MKAERQVKEAMMSVYRKWYCSCSGRPEELVYNDQFEDEAGEPECSRCGASPSSDPKHTISFRDQEEWDD